MPDEDLLARMRSDWDGRAQENAFHYIASGRDDWEEEAFYESGRESVEEFLIQDQARVFRGCDPKLQKVLEIGCGAGRMTRALAPLVKEVHAIDVSGEMVRRATAATEGLSNAFVYHNDGAGLAILPADVEIDVAFSFIVFQHIPSAEVIEAYVRDVAQRLRPGGVFKMQAQGDPRATLGRQDTWEGCYPPMADWLRWGRAYGLELTDFDGAGTQYLWLWWKRVEPGARVYSDLELELLDAERRAFTTALREVAVQAQAILKQNETLRDELKAAYESPGYRAALWLGWKAAVQATSER